MTGLRISGDVEKLRAIGRALKEAGDKEQKRELIKAVQRATKPIKREIKESAQRTLPHSGGLNRWVAALTIRTKQTFSGRAPGVTITGGVNSKMATIRTGPKIGPLREGQTRTRKTRKKGTFGARTDLRAINRGRIMHPVYGHGPLVGPQAVPSGFWDEPLTGPATRRAKQEIREAMTRVARELARKT